MEEIKKEEGKWEVNSAEEREKVLERENAEPKEGEEVREEKKEEVIPATKEVYGEINIVPEVIATIISRTVINLPGVAGLAAAKGGIGTLLGSKELEKGIKVDLAENKEVSTTISVILEYGSAMIQIAKEMQKKVKEELENKTGLKVKEVNINIQGVHLEEGK